MTNDTKELQDQLFEAKQEILELQARTKTTLLPSQFLVIIMIGPLFMAFVALGVLIVWKTLSKPAEVAPHLDIVLVAFSIFSGPCIAAAVTITGLMGEEIKNKLTGGNKDG